MWHTGLMPIVKAPARKCWRLLGKVRRVVRPVTVPKEDLPIVPFRCNVCGTKNRLPQRRLTREDGHCEKCSSYGRLRSMMYAVTAHFSPGETVLARMKPRKDIRGLGCSDWGYTDLLAKKFDYVNTFYDHEPQLDLCNVDWSRWAPESFDFITCTDVLEHVEPPVERMFENMLRLLKPGGVAILTVPTTLDPATREHFPHLHDWQIETENEQRVLVNRRRDGTVERFDDLCWHGGEGMTLEFRVFSRQGLLDSVQKAGFRVATIYDSSFEYNAIPLSPHNFVLVAQKPGSPEKTNTDPPPFDAYQLVCDCQEEIAVRRRNPGPDIYKYASRYRRAEWGYWQHVPHWMHEDFRERPACEEPLRCLDVGCAYGTLLLYAIKLLRCKPYAVDFVNYLDPSLVKDYGIQYLINNIEREPFPWNVRFDVILFTEVLEHLNFNAVPTLKKLQGLLVPGGRLYLSTPDASQWGRKTKHYARYCDVPVFSADSIAPLIDDHVWQFDEEEVKRLAEVAGFRVVRHDYSPGRRRFLIGPRRRHLNMTLEASS